MLETSKKTGSLPTGEFATVSEVCDFLRCGKTRVYGLLDAGELPCLRVGRLIRIPVAAVQAFVDAHLTTGAEKMTI
jgi:excisionase family DNA binding protein